MKIHQRHDTIEYQDAKTLEEMNERLRHIILAHNENSSRFNDAMVEIEKQSSSAKLTSAINVAVSAAGGGGGGSTRTAGVGGYFTLTSIAADTFVGFPVSFSGGAVVRLWYMDSSLGNAEIYVAKDDVTSSGFTFRSALMIGTAGTYFYIAQPRS